MSRHHRRKRLGQDHTREPAGALLRAGFRPCPDRWNRRAGLQLRLSPAILVLDEPTSHLDSQSELAVQSLIDQRRGTRTTIVISHRPLNVSRIIDLNENRICAVAS